MKTFEERYTAWIDGQLTGAELAAFEQELTRRGEIGDAQADRADCGRLRLFLQEKLRAPELSNQDFFSLQVRQRIDAERQPSRAAATVARPIFAGLFAWRTSSMLGAGVACLGLAAVLYVATISRTRVAAPAAEVAKEVAETAAAAQAPAGVQQNPRPSNDLMARNDAPGPASVDQPADLAVTVPDAAATGATATPLHYRQPNVNVLWISGLDYLPSVPGSDDAGAAAQGSPAAATAAPEATSP
jgi:hypothetical protein